jgi:hypothetical protein
MHELEQQHLYHLHLHHQRGRLFYKHRHGLEQQDWEEGGEEEEGKETGGKEEEAPRAVAAARSKPLSPSAFIERCSKWTWIKKCKSRKLFVI